MSSVSIQELVVTRSGYPAVANSTFDLPDRHLTLLTGDNGSGKTTLLLAICGLLETTRGEINLGGKDFNQDCSRALRKKFGYVGHDPLFMRHIKVLEHLKLCAQLDSKKNKKFSVEINEGLKKFGLSERSNTEVSKLSAGQIRRLHLLSALVCGTKTLCLDEPHSSLDKKSKELVDEIILSQFESGRNFIIATHDPDRILNNATHHIHIQNGCTTLEVLQ